MREWRILLTIVALSSVLFSFRYLGTTKQIVRLAGSTAFLPFAEQLAEVYMMTHPDISVETQGGGSATGLMASLAGIVDIGMADLLTLPKEVDSLQHVIVARDGIAVIVHPSNPVSSFTLDQLSHIFQGQITNWKEVGGEEASIRIISREEGSGTRKSFDTLILKGKKLEGKAMFQDSNGTIRETVKNDPHSIGYISISFIDDGIKAATINGTEPTNGNVVNGIYPLSRPIFFLLPEQQTPEAKDFVSFVLSNEGQALIAKNGLIPAKL